MNSEQLPDGSGETARYTHGHSAAVLSAHSRRGAADSAAYLLAHLRAGMDLLDVGCGPASITADLAASPRGGSWASMPRPAPWRRLGRRFANGVCPSRWS